MSAALFLRSEPYSGNRLQSIIKARNDPGCSNYLVFILLQHLVKQFRLFSQRLLLRFRIRRYFLNRPGGKERGEKKKKKKGPKNKE